METFQRCFTQNPGKFCTLINISGDSIDTDYQPKFALVEKPPIVAQPAKQFFPTQLLSEEIDWLKVSACLSNPTSCVCYGRSAEKLIVPKETCELAVNNGWNSKI